MNTIINDIYNDITNDNNNHPVCIYISIGAKAGMIKNDILDEEHYHQYPLFLKEMNNNVFDMKTYFILIDPCLEEIPYMITDNNLNIDFKKNDIINNNNDIQKWTSNRHIVYTYRQNVIIKYNNEICNQYDYVDITEVLINLNNLCMDLDILLICHHFTGILNNKIAQCFDNQIKHHLNHIIYGIGERGDHSCYFDLRQPLFKFPYKVVRNRVNKRDMITVFNVYDYLINNSVKSIEQSIEIFGIHFIDMITEHINYVIKEESYYFKNTILYVIRTFYMYAYKEDYNASMDYLINMVYSELRDDVKTMCENGVNKEQLYMYIRQKYSNSLDNYVILTNNYYTSEQLIDKICRDKDCYKWYNEMKNYIY